MQSDRQAGQDDAMESSTIPEVNRVPAGSGARGQRPSELRRSVVSTVGLPFRDAIAAALVAEGVALVGSGLTVLSGHVRRAGARRFPKLQVPTQGGEPQSEATPERFSGQNPRVERLALSLLHTPVGLDVLKQILVAGEWLQADVLDHAKNIATRTGVGEDSIVQSLLPLVVATGNYFEAAEAAFDEYRVGRPWPQDVSFQDLCLSVFGLEGIEPPNVTERSADGAPAAVELTAEASGSAKADKTGVEAIVPDL